YVNPSFGPSSLGRSCLSGPRPRGRGYTLTALRAYFIHHRRDLRLNLRAGDHRPDCSGSPGGERLSGSPWPYHGQHALRMGETAVIDRHFETTRADPTMSQSASGLSAARKSSGTPWCTRTHAGETNAWPFARQTSRRVFAHGQT